jgi:hypothetical protein
VTCGIYRITENETGRHYIGQSKNIEKRWKGHRKRFPPELFSYHIVITCVPDSEVLDCLEKFCIADFKGKMLGFNLTKGGNGAWSHQRILSEEHKRKISDSLKGRKQPPISDETKRKMSDAKKGNTYKLGKTKKEKSK